MYHTILIDPISQIMNGEWSLQTPFAQTHYTIIQLFDLFYYAQDNQMIISKHAR